VEVSLRLAGSRSFAIPLELNGGHGGRGKGEIKDCPLLAGQGSMTLAWYVTGIGLKEDLKCRKIQRRTSAIDNG
jgi:hypothetical protein